MYRILHWLLLVAALVAYIDAILKPDMFWAMISGFVLAYTGSELWNTRRGNWK